MRKDNRKSDQMRPITIIPHYNPYAEGSCLIKVGQTHVICTATIESGVPKFLKGTGEGWITAEYGMLPRSTVERMDRESKKGQSGRTQEIQRLIGRSLRSVVDFSLLGERTIKIDCDVIQADGGTRTASITGGYVAMSLAIQKMMKDNNLSQSPIKGMVCAISCGIVDGIPMTDLAYDEDSKADTDGNFILTDKGEIIEIQTTAEKEPMSKKDFLTLLSLATKACKKIALIQTKAIKKD